MTEFCFIPHKKTIVHFIGIGGISMSGIAEILLQKGFEIHGSDAKSSPIIERLIKGGAKISIGHSSDNVKNADFIIYTDAVNEDNEELIEAKKRGIPLFRRAEFLGQLMKHYENSIVVSGTHGKTSTTSMLSTIFNHTDLKPTMLVGGELADIGGNVKLGENQIFITEGCEYKANILNYFPNTAIILNIDSDHLDFFKDINDVLNTFVKYVQKLSSDDHLILYDSCYGKEQLMDACKGKVFLYGEMETSDFVISNIRSLSVGTLCFDLMYQNQKYPVTLNGFGEHNAHNATAAIAASVISGVPMQTALANIALYEGVHRRLEKRGIVNGITIFDDYAHHPTEIRVTLSALRKFHSDKLIVVFQPHTYTRTQKLLREFGTAFEEADIAIITDIYAAREKDLHVVHSKDLVEEINRHSSNALYLSSFDEIRSYVKNHAEPGSLLITVGAGDVYQLADRILEE